LEAKGFKQNSGQVAEPLLVELKTLVLVYLQERLRLLVVRKVFFLNPFCNC